MITHTRKVDFKPLLDVLNGLTSKGAAVVGPADWSMALSMIDHALHQNAKRTSILIKNSVFPPNSSQQQANYLGESVIAYRGIYLAAKAAFTGFANGKPLRALTINVDATCVAFWRPGPLVQVICQFLGYQNPAEFEKAFANEAKGLSNDAAGDARWKGSRLNKLLMKLKNVRVIRKHLQKQGTVDKQEPIARFLRKPPSAEYMEVQEGKDIPAGKYSVAQYFAKKYPNFNTRFSNLPLVILGKDNALPMEVLEVIPNQKYGHKLSGQQTTKMLNLAAELPEKRHASIMRGVHAMGWPTDPWLKSFGLKANPQTMIKTTGRLLPSPDLEFKERKKIGSDKTKQGRWIIQNMKFVKSNGDSRMPITSWACVVIKGSRGPAVNQDQAKSFTQLFRNIYVSHGGVFNCAAGPHMYLSGIQDIGDRIAECIDQTTKVFKEKPQLVFFIVADQSVDVYEAIKKSMDCRWGVASQVCWSKHVVKNQPQYHSNICLKVNAKLGGSTTYARSKSPLIDQAGFYKPEERVMVIGSDVTHPPPGPDGLDAKSVACLVMSRDPTLTSYMGAVAINNHRQDIIHRKPMNEMMAPQLKTWMRLNGGKLPKRILYFRDGVAREMAKYILDTEVAQIKDSLANAMNSKEGAKLAEAVTFTVVIATKRHHTRIFPEPNKGDKNGNCLPGTFVDMQATGAVDLDWFMISHVALKGTAKPMHYNVVLDENKYKMEALQQFVHDSCFQYVRSTTSVSQYPAIYYAHLAAKRGIIHEAKPLSSQSDGKKEIDAARAAGKSTRDALSAYDRRRAEDRALWAENWEMDPVAGQLRDHMWFC